MAIARQTEQNFGKGLLYICRLLVWFGGAILCAIALLTFVSVLGRAFTGFGLGPITGDFELVEAGTAVAVFAFLPWCQLNRGHVSVDLFTRWLPARVQIFLMLLGNIAIAFLAIIIAWRLWMGMGERVTWFSQALRDTLGFGYKPFSVETTYILGMPVWYGYALCFIGAALFAIVSVYCVWRDINDLMEGESSH